METILAAPVTFTEGAKTELLRLLQTEEVTSDMGLRVGVNGGGCAGMTYVLGFDKQEDKDTIYEIDGIKVFMKKAHALYLIGMQIDFQHGLSARGFTFNNPNASSTCGCGQSFGV